MASARKRKKQRRRNRKLGDCARQFLTPAVWRQVQNGMLRPWRASRWRIQPLVMVLILMTFACGDSQEERFECARAVVVALLPKRRRPGKTVHGFEKALARLPMWSLRRVAAAVRRRLPEVLARRWTTNGFIVLGCDGSRLECPRAVALEERMGQAGKQDAAPTMWLTALVHLATGVPYSWRVGKGTASERDHLKHLLSVLPLGALVVCDAGYTGYDLCASMLQNSVDFLIRMSSTVTLYTTTMQPLETYREGIVYYWTDQARKAGLPALRLRLIRREGEKKGKDGKEKHDVWLLTSVLSSRRLPAERAGLWYRWRWENEGFFRTYKRTLNMVKLCSRTVASLHREAEGSLLATQLLLAMAADSLPASTQAKASPRQAVRKIRREFQRLIGQQRVPPLSKGLARAVREQRERLTPKSSREWPRRKPHKPPGAPHLLWIENITNTEKTAARWAA
jgi:Transposase DDE domain